MNIENGFFVEFPEGSLDIVDDVKDDLIITLSNPEDGLWLKFPEGTLPISTTSNKDSNFNINYLSGKFF